MLVDSDVHNTVPTFEMIRGYLPAHWQESMDQSDFKGPAPDLYPAGISTTTTTEAAAPNGADLTTIQSQILDRHQVDCAILNCAYALEALHNPYGVAALASAVNDWQQENWLDREPKLRASLVVPSHEPDLAVLEIERMGDRSGFVQIYLPVRSRELYGTRRYHPLYRAALDRGLVIGIHAGGAPAAPPSSSGWPSYFVEEYVGMAHLFQSQIINMIVEGVFDEFPELRVTLIASGFTWLPGFMWRLDKEWKGLRREVPWVKRPPSDYIRQHVRFSLQPLDLPPDVDAFQQVLAQSGSDELLLYSSDFPFTDHEQAKDGLPTGLSHQLESKILYENGAKWYGLT